MFYTRLFRFCFLWLVVFSFLQVSYAQNGTDVSCFYQYYALSQTSWLEGDTTKAMSFLNKAITTTNKIPTYLLPLIAQSYVQFKDKEKAFLYLKESYLTGYPDTTYMSLFQTNYPLEWKSLMKEYPELRKTALLNIDFETLDELTILFGQDDYVRTYLHKFDNKETNKYLIQVDSINLQSLKAILKKYDGFPPYEKVGFLGQRYCWLLLLHSSIDMQNKVNFEVFDVVERALKEGKMNSADYAVIMDRICVLSDKPTKYGSGMFENGKAMKIEDIDNLDKRRLLIGLSPLRYESNPLFSIPKNYQYKPINFIPNCK